MMATIPPPTHARANKPKIRIIVRCKGTAARWCGNALAFPEGTRGIRGFGPLLSFFILTSPVVVFVRPARAVLASGNPLRRWLCAARRFRNRPSRGVVACAASSPQQKRKALSAYSAERLAESNEICCCCCAARRSNSSTRPPAEQTGVSLERAHAQPPFRQVPNSRGCGAARLSAARRRARLFRPAPSSTRGSRSSPR
jgi:hypothetical protein